LQLVEVTLTDLFSSNSGLELVKLATQQLLYWP